MRKSNGLECENECYENKYNVRTRRTLILLNLVFFYARTSRKMDVTTRVIVL